MIWKGAEFSFKRDFLVPARLGTYVLVGRFLLRTTI